ncbi:MAG TPA: putative lipid II flippase FtsW [Deltaproteobacteria bacterium]|nr:putative lipid II flippase FtsW [Deltaproteobacteria bacterium]
MRPRDQAAHVLEIDFDVIFFLVTVVLIMMGTVMILSSSFFISKERLGSGLGLFARHLAHLVVGAVAMIAAMAVDYRRLARGKLVYALVACAVILLVCCFIPGIGRAGGHAKRWVDLGFFVVQASEFAKLSLVLYFAYHLSRKSRLMHDFSRGALPLLLVVAVVCLLIFAEPDFGTAATVGLWSLGMLVMGGMPLKHLLVLCGTVLPLGLVGLLWEPYRRVRIITFLDPWKDMLGSGYQIIQSMVAFANGGVLGAGLGEGSQKLFYLPEPHTDFILAVVGEETGFLGVLLVTCLFGLWIWRGFSIAQATNDAFGYYAALASVSLVGLQAIINMGVELCLLPTKGLPLPFFSYGGSTLISTMSLCGLVLSVSRRARL